MILTVTPNTAIDKILFIDEWIPETVMRSPAVVSSVGGKGLDSSVVLRHLGLETVGLCMVAGETGEELINLLDKYGIIPAPIWVEGQTRVANVISELKTHHHSHIIAGDLKPNDELVMIMMQKFQELLPQAKWVICAGSVPPTADPGIFADFVRLSHEAGVPVLVDSHLEPIRQAMAARPTIAKMNWREFEAAFGLELPALSDLTRAARNVYSEYQLEALVLTLGSQGTLAFCRQGEFQVIPPKLDAINAAGAGDAVSSALVWRLSIGDDWPTALRWAAATSAAVVLTEGTADCRMEDILEIFPKVIVQRVLSIE
jgi:1-phosphofructokinase family hexose kinase